MASQTIAPAPTLNEQDYRPCVGISLFNKQGQVFMAKRIDNPNDFWQMPQGGIDDGESPLDAAIRELWEETNITSISQLGQLSDWLYYELPPELKGTAWKGRWLGQKMKWFAFSFTGSDAEISLETHTPEFRDWRWQSLSDIDKYCVPFKQAIYHKIKQDFAKFA